MLHINVTSQIFKYDKIDMVSFHISYGVLSINFDGIFFKRQVIVSGYNPKNKTEGLYSSS